jgi:hypothetical protein
MPPTTQTPPERAAASTLGRRELLRLEVGALRRRESRRVFDSSVHVGVLAGPRHSFVVRAADLPTVDDAMRVDLTSLLLEDAPDEWRTAWVVRSGTCEQHDSDLRWLAAATTAFGMHGRALDRFYVVTRTGWRDVRSDQGREWRRLRC